MGFDAKGSTACVMLSSSQRSLTRGAAQFFPRGSQTNSRSPRFIVEKKAFMFLIFSWEGVKLAGHWNRQILALRILQILLVVSQASKTWDVGLK